MLLSTLTGCGEEAEEINVYTKFQDLSDISQFDFEVNAKLYSKVTEDVEIGIADVEIGIDENPEETISPETLLNFEGYKELKQYDIEFKINNEDYSITVMHMVDENDSKGQLYVNENVPNGFNILSYDVDLEEKTLTLNEDEAQVIEFDIVSEKELTADEMKEIVLNYTNVNNEESEKSEDSVKKEIVTTETHYNLRLIGTYLDQEDWVVKVFAKDVDVKGYTNITNIYRKGNDIYVDLYSMIDSLDYLLDAEGNIKNQFEFKKGNFIKTDAKSFIDVVNAESQNGNIELTDLINAISKDLYKGIQRAGYNVVILDNVFDQVLNIAKEVATEIENEVNKVDEVTEEEGKKKKKDEEDTTPKYSFSGTTEEGSYTFTIASNDKHSKEFINKFGEATKANIKTKIQERIDYLTADMNKELKKKEEKPDHTAEIALLNEYLKMEDFWILDYADELAQQDTSKYNTDFTSSVIIDEYSSTAQVSLTYNRVIENETKTVTINIKIKEPSMSEISVPTNVIKSENKEEGSEDVVEETLASWNNAVRQVLEMYTNGTLESDESDLTPERIVAIGKLVKPAQNDNFKYKIYDRYISISEYIGTGSSVEIPDTIEDLPVYVVEASAFESADISSVKMTDNIIIIGNGAFKYCEGLQELQLSKNLIEIPDTMCMGCTSLSDLEIPYGVKSIGSSAFKDCEGLNEIVIPATVSYIGSAGFQRCAGLRQIVIMDGTIYDEEGTYIKTTGLTIDMSAFANHQAKTIIVPATVISIADDAFSPDYNAEEEPMFYGYTPSELNLHCAKNKYLFTTILAGGEIDEAIKGDMEKALQMAKSLS
jgi:hypothetical protein